MDVTRNFVFLKDVTSAQDSNICYSVNGEQMMALEVYGTATAFSITVEGILDADNETSWTTLSSIVNAGTLDVTTNITGKGIFWISTDGMYKVRVKLTAIAGGNLTVFGRFGV